MNASEASWVWRVKARRSQNLLDVRSETCTVDCVVYIWAFWGACECTRKNPSILSKYSPAQLEIKDTINYNITGVFPATACPFIG